MRKKVLYFSSHTCGPCKKLKPIVDVIVRDNDIDMDEYSVDKDMDVFKKYGVCGMPTIIVLEDDKEKGRLVGLHPTSRITELIGIDYDYQ